MWEISLTLDSPTIFDEIGRVTSVAVFIADFNLLSWELDNFTLTLLC